MITERFQKIHNKVCDERDALKKENQSLIAFLHELKIAVECGYEKHLNYTFKLDCTSDELLKRTPDKSLRYIQGDAIEKAANFFGDRTIGYSELIEYADNIRKNQCPECMLDDGNHRMDCSRGIK